MKKLLTFLVLLSASSYVFEAHAQSADRIVTGTVVDDSNAPIWSEYYCRGDFRRNDHRL